MTLLPAPYESVADDDLGAAAAAALTGTLGALVAVSIGMQAWTQIPEVKATLSDESLEGENLAVVVTTFGWGLAAVLLGLGAVLMIFRKGRGALILGSLIATAVTLVARYVFEWFTPTHPLPNPLVYYGGVAVIVLALLPATKRWVSTPRRRRGPLPPLTTATPMGTSGSSTIRVGPVG